MLTLAQIAEGPAASAKVRVNLRSLGFRLDPNEIFMVRAIGNWVFDQLKGLQIPKGLFVLFALART